MVPLRLRYVTRKARTAGQSPITIKPRLLDNGVGGYEIYLARNDDDTACVDTALKGFNDRYKWYATFITGNASDSGLCTITHAASGHLLSAPSNDGYCTMTTMLDRSSLFSVASSSLIRAS